MSLAPIELPENFRAYALGRSADVRVEHFWGAEVEGEYYPESWTIVLFREERMPNGKIWMRCIQMPDDVGEREFLWPHELDLLDMAWAQDKEEWDA